MDCVVLMHLVASDGICKNLCNTMKKDSQRLREGSWGGGDETHTLVLEHPPCHLPDSGCLTAL